MNLKPIPYNDLTNFINKSAEHKRYMEFMTELVCETMGLSPDDLKSKTPGYTIKLKDKS